MVDEKKEYNEILPKNLNSFDTIVSTRLEDSRNTRKNFN